jgi:UDP-N-acetylglucosamine 2-epimerase (non-hydrolysing)
MSTGAEMMNPRNDCKLRVATLIGTRPEAIKMAPVIHALKNHVDFEVTVMLSGQHAEMCKAALGSFDISSDVDIAHDRSDYSLPSQASRFLRETGAHFLQRSYDLVLVHGDTSTALMGALAAFYLQIPVGHVEAGLRSNDLANPFPEEANRRLIDPLCELLFAPTMRAWDSLMRESADSARTIITGNTVVDAVQMLAGRLPALDQNPRFAKHDLDGKRLILVTTHRRENWDQPMIDICTAVRDLADRYADVAVIMPVHPNPKVADVVRPLLGGHPRILLTDPLSYEDLVAVLRDAYLVLTDSGGIQEEAPTVQTPVLVLREVTERPEGIEAGSSKLVGTNRDNIIAATAALLDSRARYRQMIAFGNPFGDGRAAQRIVRAIQNWRENLPLLADQQMFGPVIVPDSYGIKPSNTTH